MRTGIPLLGCAAILAFQTVNIAQATVVGGAVTNGGSLDKGGVFQKLTTPLPNPHGPPNSVGQNTFNDPNLYAFDEAQNILIGPGPLPIDLLPNGTRGGTLPVGIEVASHLVFFDPANSRSQQGYVDFDSDIVAVLTTLVKERNTDPLARSGVNYLNPSARGLEQGDKVRVAPGLPRRLEVNWAAQSPGDYVRVLTGHAEPLPFDVIVGGSADPWLAGLPWGSMASANSAAPAQSPSEVISIPVRTGSFLKFRVRGSVGISLEPAGRNVGPNGDPDRIVVHGRSGKMGFSGCTAPVGAMVGVFLQRALPNDRTAPPALDFSTPASRDYANLAPHLNQVFYVGTGLRNSGDLKRVFIPDGATRLFLGVMATTNFTEYTGAFAADVQSEQNPALSIERSDDTHVVISWPAVPGAMVQPQYAERLNPAEWLALGPERLGDSEERSVMDAAILGIRRVYRLALRF